MSLGEKSQSQPQDQYPNTKRRAREKRGQPGKSVGKRLKSPFPSFFPSSLAMTPRGVGKAAQEQAKDEALY